MSTLGTFSPPLLLLPLTTVSIPSCPQVPVDFTFKSNGAGRCVCNLCLTLMHTGPYIWEENITRDSEIKNNLTVTRGEVGGSMGGKGVRNNYKGHMDKTKGGWN